MSTLSLVHDVRMPAPGANAPGVRPPLLLLLHGVGANEGQMSPLMHAFDPRFLVVSARSPIEVRPGAFAWFRVTFGPNGPEINRDEAEAAWRRIPQFVEEVVTEYKVDPDRVYVGGFSQGGIVSLASLLTAPDAIRGAVVMSGRLLPDVLAHLAPPSTLRDRPVLILHGIEDEKLGVSLARWAKDQLEQLGLLLTYRELEMGHTITPESVRVAGRWLSAELDALAA